MNVREGMICPVCEIGKLQKAQKDIPFEYKGEKLVLGNASVYECDVCHESLFDDKQQRDLERSLTDSRRKKDGLLTSDEIRSIRKGIFEMGQVEFAKALRVGEKNFARYESGQAAQGHAMDNLLRVLRKYPQALREIYEEWDGWQRFKEEVSVSVRHKKVRSLPVILTTTECKEDGEEAPDACSIQDQGYSPFECAV